MALYIVIQKKSNFFNKKKMNLKTKKQEHAFKSFASASNFDILNCFNPELQL